MFTLNKSLDFNELKESYPNAIKELIIWITSALKEFQVRISKEIGGSSEIPELTDDITERAADSMMQTNYRELYNFFDSKHILVLLDGPDEMHGWTWQIRSGSNIINQTIPAIGYNNRVETEVSAFKEAFKILEDDTRKTD